MWNLHLVGHADESTVQPLVADFIAALENAGHVLDQATLTTDAGPTDVIVTPPAESAPQTVAGEPVVATTPDDTTPDEPPVPPTPAAT